MKLASRFLRVRFVGRRRTSCKFLIDMLENVLPLDVLDNLIVEAWSKATDARFLLSTQVVRQVHHLFDFFLACVLARGILIRHDALGLRLSMITRGLRLLVLNGWLFFNNLFRLLRLKLFNRWFEYLLRRCYRIALLYNSLTLFLCQLSLSR
jgi:hypothetical protein